MCRRALERTLSSLNPFRYNCARGGAPPDRASRETGILGRLRSAFASRALLNEIPARHRDADSMGAVRRPQLDHDVVDVGLHRCL
jgi:hypothetical protein